MVLYGHLLHVGYKTFEHTRIKTLGCANLFVIFNIKLAYNHYNGQILDYGKY